MLLTDDIPYPRLYVDQVGTTRLVLYPDAWPLICWDGYRARSFAYNCEKQLQQAGHRGIHHLLHPEHYAMLVAWLKGGS